MTSFEAIHNAARSLYKTSIVDVYSVQTQWDNAPLDIDDSSLGTYNCWSRFNIRPGLTDITELGETKTYRTPGIVIIQLFSKIEEGDRDALRLADKIKETFRSVTTSGVHFRTPYISNSGRTDNKWWQINVYCPFYSDDTD